MFACNGYHPVPIFNTIIDDSTSTDASQLAAAANFALELALVALWASSHPAVLSFIASGIILILSHAEDKKATRPSALLNIYLAFSIVFDATQVRTAWLLHYDHVAAVHSAAVGIKISMLLLEAQQKGPHLLEPYKNYPPEATSGFWSLCFVWWLNSLFVAGFQKLLTTDDLSGMDINMTSQVIGHKLQKAWDECSELFPDVNLLFDILTHFRNSKGIVCITNGCSWLFRCTLIAAAFPRLCMVGFTFAQPFLIASAIKYLENSNPTQNRNDGFGMIGGAFLIYFGIAV